MEFPIIIDSFDSRDVGDSDGDFILKKLYVDESNGHLIVWGCAETIDFFDTPIEFFKWPMPKKETEVKAMIETLKDLIKNNQLIWGDV